MGETGCPGRWIRLISWAAGLGRLAGHRISQVNVPLIGSFFQKVLSHNPVNSHTRGQTQAEHHSILRVDYIFTQSHQGNGTCKTQYFSPILQHQGKTRSNINKHDQGDPPPPLSDFIPITIGRRHHCCPKHCHGKNKQKPLDYIPFSHASQCSNWL